jgi:hypothetical protein
MTKEWVCDSFNRFITAMFVLVQNQDIDEGILRFPSDSNVFLYQVINKLYNKKSKSNGRQNKQQHSSHMSNSKQGPLWL